MTIVPTIVILAVLIVAHEFGHFVAARRSGVQVDEFSVGFGPLLWSHEGPETMYSIRLVPLGGYCKMAGEQGAELAEDEQPSGDDTGWEEGRGFVDQSLLSRAAILTAGPAMNLLVAVILFFSVFALIGIGQPTTSIDQVMKSSPAQQAGLQAGDKITAINGQPVKSGNDLVQYVQAHPGQSLKVTIQRGQTTKVLTITPRDVSGKGQIGIYLQVATQRENPLAAIKKSVMLIGVLVGSMLTALGNLVTTGHASQLMGVVGIGVQVGKAAHMGLAELVFLVGAISTSLGIVNLLPVPALDGGRLAFLALEGIRGKPVDPEKEGFIHFIGFGLLILLAIFVTYHDILRLT